MTCTTSRWGDLVFTTVQRILEALTSRSMWVMVAATAGVWYVLRLHSAGAVGEVIAQFAMGSWVAAFIGAAAKRGATTIAALRNGHGGQ